MKIIERYGTVLRIYDNGGKTADRYTIVPPRWAHEYREHGRLMFRAIVASAHPYHPQGIGMHVTAAPGPYLGARIRWDDLPAGAQRFAREAFPEYAPSPGGVE